MKIRTKDKDIIANMVNAVLPATEENLGTIIRICDDVLADMEFYPHFERRQVENFRKMLIFSLEKSQWMREELDSILTRITWDNM